MLNNEVDVYQALDHPNIVKFIECFEDEKVISIIMELMEEGNVSFQIFSLS
jgi:serine/threonine protein kinase